MMSEQNLRWMGFITASFLVHAAALAWLDFTGADYGQLPSTLTVHIKSSSDGKATESLVAPASATRSRDLFARPPTQVAKTKPFEVAEDRRQPVEAEIPPAREGKTNEKASEPRVEAKTVAEAPKPMDTAAEKIETVMTPTAASISAPLPPEEIYREPMNVAAAAGDALAKAAAAPDGSSTNNAEHEGRLLSLLHQAISREKRYPMLARRQRREGTATVSFSLSPSGDMDAIGIDRSSGFSVLDTAAVSAVSRVAPFTPARLFLSDVTRFKVDVTFKLN